MRRPAAISFGVGYTPLMHAPTGQDLYQRVLAQCGIEASPEVLAEAMAPARDFYIRSTRAGREFEASMEQALGFWGEYNALVLEALGVPTDPHRRGGQPLSPPAAP